MSALFNVACTDEDGYNLDAVIKADNPTEAIEIWRKWAAEVIGLDELEQYTGEMVIWSKEAAAALKPGGTMRLYLVDPYGKSGVLGWDEHKDGGILKLWGVIYP